MALERARGPLLVTLAVYVLSVATGVVLASAGVPFAVHQRDSIVAGAQSSPTLVADRRGEHLRAALLDFGSNLLIGAVPTSITGLTVIGPFPIAVLRGFVGGVVSIDANHRSRLLDPDRAVYYLVTLALQLAGYVLTTGAGVHVGLSAWRARGDKGGRSIAGFRIRRAALADALCLYALAVPAFLAGSLWEFLR